MQILSALAAHQSQPNPKQQGLSELNASQTSPRATTATGTSGASRFMLPPKPVTTMFFTTNGGEVINAPSL